MGSPMVSVIQIFSLVIAVLNTGEPTFYNNANMVNNCLQLSESCKDDTTTSEKKTLESLGGLVTSETASILHISNVLQQRDCMPKIELRRCNTKYDDSPQWIWRRDYTYTINGIATKGCSSSSLKYKWTLQNYKTGKYIKDFPQYENKPIFVLDYFELDTGKYTLIITVIEISKGKSRSNMAKCLITIRPEIPIAVILGGVSRTVPSKMSFRMEGNNSRNMDVRPGDLALLNFRWSCEVEPVDSFCSKNPISHANHVIVPSSNAVSNSKYKFKLEVSTDYTGWVPTEQTVYVKDGAHKVFISCIKNCEKKINYRSVIFLQVNCEDCPKENYEWSMKPGPNNKKKSINFATETVFGKNNIKLIIKEDILVPGDIYTFTATYNGGNSVTSQQIVINQIPTGKCEIVPTEGKSLTTVFNITCGDVAHPDPVVFKLLQSGSEPKEPGTLLAANEEGRFSLLLPPGKSNILVLELQIVDIYGLYSTQKLKVTVKPLIPDIPPNQQIKKIMDEYQGKNVQQNSVNSLIKEGNVEGAIQLINVLTGEVGHISKDAAELKEFQTKFKLMAMGDLKMIPVESQDMLLQTAATINNLQRINTQEVDRAFASPATQMCKKIARKQLYNLRNAPDPNILGGTTATLSRDVFECANANMKANFKDLTPDDIVINITTPETVVTFPVIPEHYPNYDDADYEYALKLNDYQDITANSIEALITMGLGIAYTMVPGEPIREVRNYTNVIEIATDEAQRFPRKRFGDFNSYVQGSPSLAKFKSLIVDGVIIAFPKTPYWWNPEARNLSGNVLNVNFFLGNGRIKKLGKPMHILFDVDKKEGCLINGSVSVPKDVKQWTPKNLDYNMTVHRVDVKWGTALIIRFTGLAKDEKVQVVLIHGRRPHTKDFDESIPFSQDKPMVISTFPKKMLKYGDVWFYIGILPDKSMLKKSSTNMDVYTFNYTVSFVSASCVFWNATAKAWLSTGCWTGRKTTETHLHCLCFHRSSFSGSYEDAPNKIDQISNVTFTLAMQTNHVVFICVCFIIGTYCACLVLGVKMIKSSQVHKKRALFLGDNLQLERYAYLVVVKTGNKYSAGTTSNVGLKIFGQKCDSKAHIINYPDPNKNLLQRDKEDWFILTTEKHLGTLKHIILWHDSIGLRPSWYCEWIFILDLQDKTEWWFEVQTWFSVLKEEKVSLTIKSSTSRHLRMWKYKHFERLMKYIKKHHVWNIFGSEEHELPYFLRVTIILSTILTTYSWSLILYGCPRMRLYDGLGYGHFHMYSITIFAAFFSSLISFSLNFIHVFLFRKSFYHNKETPSSSETIYYKSLPWVLLTSMIIIWITFLLVFGFWVAYVTSLLWICSTLGALIQIIFLLENVRIIFGTSILLKKEIDSVPTANTHDIVKEIEEQRQNIFSVFGKVSLRPHFRHKYRPLTREEWKTKKEQELARNNIGELVQDLVMFVVYVVLLYQIVLANKDSLNVYSHNEMKDLLYGEHTRTTSFADVQTIDEFYDYINKTFIPSINAISWYGTWNMLEPGLMMDFNTKILGLARFRQQRVFKSCCDVADVVQGLNLTCTPEFSSHDSDVGEYMEFWREKKFVAVPRLIDCWKYKYDAMSSIGEVAIYPSGGYGAPLGRTIYNSYYNLEYYKSTKWIDHRTRVIFIEFLAYNANYNIFHAVKLILEQSASGLFIKSHTIYTTRLLFVKLEFQRMLAVAFFIFIVTLFIMFFRNINIARKQWRTFFKSTWNIVDIIIIIMSYICIAMYLHRSRLVGEFLRQLEGTKHNHFVSYFNLIYMEEAFTVVASSLICIATIRLWKLLRFGTVFKIMERTLVLSTECLVAVGILHLIILLMFSFFGYFLFGPHSSDFRNFTVTLTTLVLLSLNLHPQFDYKLLIEIHGGIGYAFYVLYMLITMTIFTLYIAVITLSYTESGNYFSELTEYYTVERYISDETKYLRELVGRSAVKVRLAGGADSNTIQKKVTPKSEAHRYANSVFISNYRLFVMSLMTRSIIHNFLKTNRRKPLSKVDVDLMEKIVVHTIEVKDVPEPKCIFFIANAEGEDIKFVSDDRILKMEYIVNSILNESAACNSKIEPMEDIDYTIIPRPKTDCEIQLEYFENILQLLLRIFNNIDVSSYKV